MQIGALAAPAAERDGQFPRIDSRDTRFAGALQQFGQRFGRTEVGGGVQLVDHQPVQKQSAGFDILRIAAVIADFRRGQRHELAGVGGIGEDLLIAGHAGVEHRFPDRVDRRAEAPAPEDFAVGEGEESGPLPHLFPLVHLKLLPRCFNIQYARSSRFSI